MRRTHLISVTVLAFLFIIGCAKDGRLVDEKEAAKRISAQRAAPPKVEDSFSAQPGKQLRSTDLVNGEPTLAVDSASWELTIQRDSLDKAFLLTAMGSDTGAHPSASLYAAKVVAFRLAGGSVALHELNAAAVFDDFPADKLLQTFPVTKQTEKSVSFRWNYGFASVSTVDMSGAPAGSLDAPEPSLATAQSYVRDISFRENQMIIRQVARVKGLKGEITEEGDEKKLSTQEVEKTIHVAYVLSPYKLNPGFKPKELPALKGVGYFTMTKTARNSGAEMELAQRYDFSSGPFTWVIAKNVPKEAADAMGKGILYWNLVAGKELFRVELEGDLDQVPTARRGVVHWGRHDSEGFAYANMTSDPFTGETVSALLHFSSGWYNGIGIDVERIFAPASSAGPAGFRARNLCRHQHLGGRELLRFARDSHEDKMRRLMNDVLALVTAHEVGHTLGLRHHFSASLFSKLATPADREAAFRDYLANAEHPGAEIGSSVMDYSSLQEDALGGAWIRKNALSYDKLAIRWGYDEAHPPGVTELAETLFCTDEEAGRLVGCLRHDTGTVNPPLSLAQDAAIAYESYFPRRLLGNLVDVVAPGFGRERRNFLQAMHELNPDAEFLPRTVRYAGGVSASFGLNAKFVAPVKRDLGAAWASDGAADAASREALLRFSAEAGGMPGYLRLLLKLGNGMAPPRGALREALNAEIARQDFSRITLADGTKGSLSEAEVTAIRQFAPKYADAVEAAIQRDTLAAFTGVKMDELIGGNKRLDVSKLLAYEARLAHSPVLVKDEWQPELADLAADMILRQDSILELEHEGKKISVPKRAFRTDIRLAAARLYAPGVFSRDAGWMEEAHQKTIAILEENLKKVATPVEGEAHKFKVASSANAELRAYVKGEMAVLGAILKARNPD